MPGALAGRERLTSSTSRALDAVTPRALRPMTDALLYTIAEVDEVLLHPAVQSCSASTSTLRSPRCGIARCQWATT